MLDGLLWTVVRSRPVWSNDGYLQWLLLERHRLTGATRTSLVDERWDATHASQFAGGPEEVGE